MKIFLAFIFYFLSITINAQTCDSLIIINTPTYSDGYQNFPATFEIDSLINGLIISKTINGQRSEYRYDSLQRLTNIAGTDSTAFLYDSLSRLIYTDYYSFNGTNWIYKTDTARSAHLFNTNNQDSIEILYSWNGSALIPFHEYSYFYNSNDTLVRIEIRNRYSLQLIFDSLTIVSYPSGLVGISRVDTTSADSIRHIFLPKIISYYDSLNRITYIEHYIDPTSIEYLEWFDYGCNQLSSYNSRCQSCHTGPFITVHFDNLCRIKEYLHGYAAPPGSGWTSISNFYYANCTTMALQVSNDKKICKGDTVTLLANHYGGTGPYHTQWYPSQGLESDTSSVTKAYPDETTDYVIVVTDSNGATISDTIRVNVSDITFNTIVTDPSCQNCNDGTIVFNAIGGFPDYTFTIDGTGTQGGNLYNNLATGNHTICVMDIIGCSLCKDFQIILNTGSIPSNSDFYFYPNPFSESTWFNYPAYNSSFASTLFISDMIGNKVREIKINSDRYEFKRENLSNGIYIFSILKNNNIVARGKMVIQ